MSLKKLRSKLVGFTGAGGTGKSTTAQYIGSGVPSLVTGMRHLIYGNHAKFSDMDKKSAEFLSFQSLILSMQMHQDLLALKKDYPNAIIVPVERSVIDYAAYTLHVKEGSQSFYSIYRNQVDTYVNTCIDYANNTYKGLVYFPPGIFSPSDKDRGVKENDADSIALTDKNIQSLLEKVTIPVLRLSSATIEDRANEIVEFFKE